jgi:hypothetical protein
MPDIDIANVVTITISQPPAGLSNYEVNNLALFTKDEPVQPVAGGYAVYLAPSAVAADWGTESEVYKTAAAIFSQAPNILSGGGSLIVFPMLPEETLTAAITRCADLAYFTGILPGFDPVDMETAQPYAEILAASATVQALDKMLFFVRQPLTSVDQGEIFDQIRASGNTHTRCLLYTPDNPRLFAAAYAGRAMSTDFAGSATTATMHLKDLATIAPDPLLTQTIINKCITSGADVYAGIAGLSKVFTSGGNDFFDNIYNTIWFKGALEVAGFNALATTATKIPQTEPGMSVLKGAYRLICEQAIGNGFIAPGAWNSPDTFGNPDDLRRNVEERGYYIYSQPVNRQPQPDREDRVAPLIQMAVKFAGAIHSSSLIVNVNR